MSTKTPKIPTAIYAEMTPNPVTMKFVCNRMLVEQGAEYLSKAEAIDSSPLAEELFNFPFITGVFISRNFITLAKNDSVEWDMINLELRTFLTEYLEQGKPTVVIFPHEKRAKEIADSEDNVHAEPTSETDQKIIDLLEEYIRPAVESDGGAINFKSYNDGIVTVIMRGACAGCPSSSITLKNGIQAVLQEHLPEIESVVAEDF